MAKDIFQSSWALLEFVYNHKDQQLKLHDLMKRLPENKRDRIIERFIDKGYIQVIHTQKKGASANVRIRVGGGERKPSRGGTVMGDTVMLTEKGENYWKRIFAIAEQLDEDDMNILFQIDTGLKQKDFLEEASKYGLSEYILNEKIGYLEGHQLIRIKNPQDQEASRILEVTDKGKKYLNFLQEKFF